MTLTKRQNEIIDAALKLTACGGIQNLTVKNLSAAVGVTEPALYRHFKNKAEIIEAMIVRFDKGVPILDQSSGLEGVKMFVLSRFDQVEAQPDLAKVMFAEELFMDDPDFVKLMLEMRRRHKNALENCFRVAQEKGLLRSDISPDMLFRIVSGPVRMLVKQWGMTNRSFNLRAKGDELLDALSKLLLSSNKKNE